MRIDDISDELKSNIRELYKGGMTAAMIAARVSGVYTRLVAKICADLEAPPKARRGPKKARVTDPEWKCYVARANIGATHRGGV